MFISSYSNMIIKISHTQINGLPTLIQKKVDITYLLNELRTITLCNYNLYTCQLIMKRLSNKSKILFFFYFFISILHNL